MYLLFGTHRTIPPNCTVFNFSSLAEGYIPANIMPPNSLGAVNEYDFDVKYMHYILDNDIIFFNFMNIINELNSGRSVYILISLDQWSIDIVESLMKLIQQRYGYNGCFIQDLDDIASVNEVSCTDYGLYNLDADLNRYLMLYEQNRIMNGGQPYVE